jgi:hypothetical protein
MDQLRRFFRFPNKNKAPGLHKHFLNEPISGIGSHIMRAYRNIGVPHVRPYTKEERAYQSQTIPGSIPPGYVMRGNNRFVN